MQGQKLKETLVATGSLTQCEVVAKKMHTRSVTDTTKEKPVTKQMLKEIWHWDESLSCNIVDVGCFLLSLAHLWTVNVCCIAMKFNIAPIFANTLYP